MRVLSFIPAFLLTAAGFVAAAPAPSPDDSCTIHPSGGNGNDAPLQPFITVIAAATADLQPLSTQLSGLQGDACTPDAVSEILVKVTAVIQTCVGKLQATAQVDLDSLDLTNLCTTIYAHLEVVLCLLNALVLIIGKLGLNATVSIQAAICAFLNIIVSLAGCLKVFAVASISATLSPLIASVTGLVDICLTIVAKVSITA